MGGEEVALVGLEDEQSLAEEPRLRVDALEVEEGVAALLSGLWGESGAGGGGSCHLCILGGAGGEGWRRSFWCFGVSMVWCVNVLVFWCFGVSMV